MKQILCELFKSLGADNYFVSVLQKGKKYRLIVYNEREVKGFFSLNMFDYLEHRYHCKIEDNEHTFACLYDKTITVER
jgi:hypothetical protein